MIRALLTIAALVLWCASAHAQSNWPTPGGAIANGAVQLCLNSSGQAVPASNGTCAAGQQVTTAPTNSAGAYAAVTVGTSTSQALAASTAKVFLDIVNLSPTATICVNFGATATIAGSICAAGEITLPPLYHRSFEGAFVPSDSVNVIASASSTPASIGAK